MTPCLLSPEELRKLRLLVPDPDFEGNSEVLRCAGRRMQELFGHIAALTAERDRLLRKVERLECSLELYTDDDVGGPM